MAFELRWRVDRETIKSGHEHLRSNDRDQALVEAKDRAGLLVLMNKGRFMDFEFRGPLGDKVNIYIELEM